MKLNSIDFKHVQEDLDNDVQTNFNTSFHAVEEAPDLAIPTELPYSFDRWLPLILQTRGLPTTSAQIVRLTRAQVRVIIDAAASSVHTRALNRAYAEDLRDEVHPAFDSLTFPDEGLFMRLGACSPKDGAHTIPGQRSLHSIGDIILRLTTSERTTKTFNKMLDNDDKDINVFFLPFDARMVPDMEYRVFCAPESLRITAVSQYRWHKRWTFADKSLDRQEATAQQILDGIKEVHAKIIDTLRDTASEYKEDPFRSQGFSFDVLYDEQTGSCELIELNTFGVLSGCGSCLFQWVRDRHFLYGDATETVEFRVAV